MLCGCWSDRYREFAYGSRGSADADHLFLATVKLVTNVSGGIIWR